MISPLLLSCWGFSSALGHAISFFGGIQHSPVNGCSAISFNFGVLIGEDECTSFYSAIFLVTFDIKFFAFLEFDCSCFDLWIYLYWFCLTPGLFSLS